MGVVGEFPGVNITGRKTQRAHVNPLDKSTVVSIYPHEINEKKPTIFPGDFHLDAGSYQKPALLVVGPSSWWREVDENQPLLEIPNSSIQVADSIVRDYCNGLYLCDMDSLMPGIFWVPGEYSVEKVQKEHKPLLDKALIKQRNWFSALIKVADRLWIGTNGNSLAISDDMRLAARELNLNDKEWLKDIQTSNMVRCLACGSLKSPDYPVCANCKTISDPKKYAELGLKQG